MLYPPFPGSPEEAFSTGNVTNPGSTLAVGAWSVWRQFAGQALPTFFDDMGEIEAYPATGIP